MSRCIQVAGIDGCKKGWIAVSLAPPNSLIILAETFPELMEQLHERDVILIDMPMGLAENREEDARRPEKCARTFIPKKGASVFNAPSKQAVYCTDYYDANTVNRRILGKGLSKQSYHIGRKIREVDTYIKNQSTGDVNLMESHPEVCFARLQSSKQPVIENKKSFIGQERRLAILQSYAPDVVAKVKRELAMSADLRRMADDVIDAACLAIVAGYGVQNGLSTIPDIPHKNRDGIPMQMVYYEG